MIKNITLFLILLFVLGISSLSAAPWHKITGKYASVEYEQPFQLLAQRLLYLADSEIPRLARLHGQDSTVLKTWPRARIILTDKMDFSNGFALGNSVVIYARSSMYMFNWVEQAPWYYTVLTHELAHWVTFKATRRKLNWFGIAANVTIPRWFYEGFAQYCAETWNLYRGDQFIRQALLYGDLNYNALQNLENGRLLYAAANAFVRYLAQQYGDSSFVRFYSYKQNAWYFDFKKAFEHVYHKSPATAFKEFIRHAVLYYGAYLSQLPEHRFQKVLASVNMDQLYRILWVSHKDSLFLLVGKEKSYHRFVTLKLVRFEQGKVQSEKILTNNLATEVVISPDRSLAAFGQPVYDIKANQLSLQFEWQIVSLKTFERHSLRGRYRARYGAFDFKNHFYLVEILPDRSLIHRWNSDRRLQKNWLVENHMILGSVTFSPENQLFLIAEQNGQRSLLQWNKTHFDTLLLDQPLLNVRMLNDRFLGVTAVEKAHLQMKVLDISTGKVCGELTDQFDYYFSDVDSAHQQLLAYRWEADGQRGFYRISYDSLFHPSVAEYRQNRYGRWQKVAPVFSDSLFKDRRFGKAKKTFEWSKKRWAAFPLENVFTMALPLYDPSAGAGFYGFTAWIEALQRQMILGAFYFLPAHFNQSFALVEHSLRAFNLLFNSGYYHGPVIFAFQDHDWMHLVENTYYVAVRKYFFPFQNGRWRMAFSMRYNFFHNRFLEKEVTFPQSFGFKGPQISFSLQYQLPTRRGLSFPLRYFFLSANLFKTFRSDYDFEIMETDASWAGELFWERLGFWQSVSFVKQVGTLPPLKSVGIDRFYQFELPRDYTYTRTIRGFGKDVLSDQLFWSSTELRYLIQEKTPYKLIFMPIQLLSLDAFMDYARLGKTAPQEVVSFGLQLSMALSAMRLSAGLARSFVDWEDGNTTYFLRFTALLNTVYAGFWHGPGNDDHLILK